MNDFIADADRALEQHGLADFEARWNLQRPAVDEPNSGRGAWSEAEVNEFLAACLQVATDSEPVNDWAQRLGARRQHKESRR